MRGQGVRAPVTRQAPVRDRSWRALLACLILAGCLRDDAARTRLFLTEAWEAYKSVYIRPEGFVWDALRGETTSEGQSYALLRAAWMDDRAAFARVLAWTDAVLLRPDGLYSWQWRPGQGVVDANSATDADCDIAFALIVAACRFQRPDYLDRARTIVQAVRTRTAVALPDGWLPSAGNWATRERIVNPSYFAPYAYAYFHLLDPAGDWPQAARTGYALLERARRLSGGGLPPDFMLVNDAGDPAPIPAGKGLSADFSFDAVRVFWRTALDCRLRGEAPACADPAGVVFLADILARDGGLRTRYSLDGRPLSEDESLSFLGCLLPALALLRPQAAETLLKDKLNPDALRPILGQDRRYYDLNWTWFGLAAVSGLIAERTPSPETVAALLQAAGPAGR